MPRRTSPCQRSASRSVALDTPLGFGRDVGLTAWVSHLPRVRCTTPLRTQGCRRGHWRSNTPPNNQLRPPPGSAAKVPHEPPWISSTSNNQQSDSHRPRRWIFEGGHPMAGYDLLTLGQGAPFCVSPRESRRPPSVRVDVPRPCSEVFKRP